MKELPREARLEWLDRHSWRVVLAIAVPIWLLTVGELLLLGAAPRVWIIAAAIEMPVGVIGTYLIWRHLLGRARTRLSE